MYVLRLISAVLHRDVGLGGLRRGARPAAGASSASSCPLVALPARPLGLARGDHASTRSATIAARPTWLRASSDPRAAHRLVRARARQLRCSPPRALALLCAVSGRRPAAQGRSTAIALRARLRRPRSASRSRSTSKSPHGHGVVVDAFRRDRLARSSTAIIVAGSGLLATGDLVSRALARGPHRRVLRAPRRRRRRDGVLRRREQPDDALPRARVVLDLPLHPLRDRSRPARRSGGGAEVPDHRRLRLRGAAVRLGARLRRHRRDSTSTGSRAAGRRRTTRCSSSASP